MESLDRLSVVLLVGEPAVSLAAAARGVADAASHSRRVAIFDLAGAFGMQDEDGLVLAFRDGRSLNALARPMADGDDQRFVVPRGPGDLDLAFAQHERWPRLVRGFRDTGALLVIVSPPAVPGLETLSTMADDAVYLLERDGEHRLVPWPPSDADLFDDLVRESRDTMPAIADLRSETLPTRFSHGDPADATTLVLNESAPSAPEPAGAALPTPAPVPRTPLEQSRDAPGRKSPPPLVRITPLSSVERVRARRRTGFVGVATLLLLSISGWYWASDRNLLPGARPETPASASPVSLPDSAYDLPALINPGDSARSAAWAVELVTTNDLNDAISRLAGNARLSAATISPVVPSADGGTWYKVTAGAYVDRAGAEYLRATLRKGGTIDADAGVVAHAPYAFRLEHNLGADAAKARVVRYVARGVAAYALLNESSRASVYVGAFASPDQAVILLAELRAAGLEPELAYRVGRTF